jgi:effector-binding domain-containing protein
MRYKGEKMLVDIKTNQELIMNNVLSIRNKLTQKQLQQEMINIGKFIQENSIKKSGSVVTTTFLVEEEDGQQVFDIEILVPLDSEIEPTTKYNFKKLFHLKNAIYTTHKGNPQGIQNTLNKMVKYINANRLQQITTAYNVNVKELKQGDSMDDFIVDIYIGVNPSIL